MAIVSNKSSLFRDEGAAGRIPDSLEGKGRIFVARGSAANAADDSSGSKYLLARLPSHAILSEETRFDVGGWGYADIRIGTETDVDALVSQTKATEDIIDPVVFGDANEGKRLWERLGLAADPGGVIGIYAHAIAAATGAGSMLFKLVVQDN